MGLNYVGGVYGGNIKPTPFLCLILKMLQIQPHKDIVVEFIKNQEYKYVAFKFDWFWLVSIMHGKDGWRYSRIEVAISFKALTQFISLYSTLFTLCIVVCTSHSTDPK